MGQAKQISVVSFQSLRWGLALLLLASLFAATSIAAALHFDRQATQAHQRVLVRQAETSAKLARVHDDEREIRAKINRYQELLRQNRIAPERRLEWVETLRRIKESRRLLGLEYEIAPRRPLDEKNPSTGGYDFHTSQMKLEMPLLHENDLLGLLADVAAQVQALVSVKSCKIERIAAGLQSTEPTLKASCEIDWITLEEKI
jgi:hypothetical protein